MLWARPAALSIGNTRQKDDNIMPDNDTPLFYPNNLIDIDRRFFSTKHLHLAAIANGASSLEEHEALCKKVKKRLLLSAGLTPMPKITAASPFVSEGKHYCGTVIKEVRIDTLPGLKLTGSLFLPENISSPLPGILCPHGHWSQGRLHHDKNGSVVMRCFQLAKLGFAVFAYDMIGYNDCNDFPHTWQGELKRLGDLYGISTFGLQTLNSMRAVDFLASLPEVDKERLGCTGASGGASQTWFLAALDDRIKVAAPVCMLSSHFQGGCACEEGPLLRVAGLTSFDIVASLAPRPLFLPCVTGDWTNHNPDYEIPRLREVYALFGAADSVKSIQFDDCHNYNRRTREYVYAWLVKELMGIDKGETIPEEDIAPPPPELLWHGGQRPPSATRETASAAFAKLREIYTAVPLPEKESLAAWQAERLDILDEMMQSTDVPAENVAETVCNSWSIQGGTAEGRVLARRMVGDRIISVKMTPEHPVAGKEVILRAVTADYRNCADELTSRLLQAGKPVRLIELAGSGSAAPLLKYAVRNSEALSAAFDDSFFSMRVQDIITTARFLKEQGFDHIRIIAENTAVPAALAAAALTGLPISVNLDGVDDSVWDDQLNYQPLMGKFGGIKTLLLLNVRAGNYFCNPGEWKGLLEQYGAKTAASLTEAL